jgi:tetratricopeptide (TPR) repeat protein
VMAYHYGPGQARMTVDDAGAELELGEQYAREQLWDEAIEKFDRVLQLLPKDKIAEMRKVRLAKAKAQMLAHQLPSAHQDLNALVDEMTDDQSAEPEVMKEARSALANSQYYLTWLMRLEGVGEETWGPEIEAARQTYRLLAEDAVKSGDAAFGRKVSEDLESTIRLARMDLGELQGLPLPSQ